MMSLISKQKNDPGCGGLPGPFSLAFGVFFTEKRRGNFPLVAGPAAHTTRPSTRRPATLVCLPDAWRQEQFVVHNAELAAPGANCFVQRQDPRGQGKRSGGSGSGLRDVPGPAYGPCLCGIEPGGSGRGRLPPRQRAKQPEPLLFSVEKTPFGLGFVLCA